MGFGFRHHLLIIALVFCAATFVGAATTQPSSVDAARKVLAEAEAKLAQIKADTDAARQARNDAAQRGYFLQRELIDASDRADNASRLSSQASSRAELASRDVEEVGALLEQIGAVIDPLKAQVDLAVAAVKDTRSAAIKGFQNGAELAAADAEIQAAQQALADEVHDIVAALEEDPVYQKLQDIAALEESQVQQRRAARPLDTGALATASRKWLAASAAVETLKQKVLAEDFFVIAARRKIFDLQAAKLAMTQKFEADLSKEPLMAQAVANAATKQAELARARNDYTQTSANLAAAQGARGTWTMNAARAEREALREQRQAEYLSFALDQARLDDLWYQSLVLQGERDQVVAGRERDAAARALQIALGNQPPTTPSPTTPSPTTQVAGGTQYPSIPAPQDRTPRNQNPRSAPRQTPASPRWVDDGSQVADAAPSGSVPRAVDDSRATDDRAAQAREAQQRAAEARQTQAADQQRAAAAQRAEQTQRSQEQHQSRAEAAREQMRRQAEERQQKQAR